MTSQWPIQDFPQGGAPTLKSAIIFQFFAKNCMKMKEFGPPGRGGARPWRPLRSANASTSLAVVSLGFSNMRRKYPWKNVENRLCIALIMCLTSFPRETPSDVSTCSDEHLNSIGRRLLTSVLQIVYVELCDFWKFTIDSLIFIDLIIK